MNSGISTVKTPFIKKSLANLNANEIIEYIKHKIFTCPSCGITIEISAEAEIKKEYDFKTVVSTYFNH